MDTQERPERLTSLLPEQVAALPPDQRELWSRQNKQDQDDFSFFQDFVEDIYADSRKYFKRMRAAFESEPSKTGDKSTDSPLYRIFDALLGLVDTLREDPEKVERMRARLPGLKAAGKRMSRDRKAKKKAEKAQKRVEKREAKKRLRLSGQEKGN